MLNIEEIKARVEKATPGPWRTSGDIEHLVCAEENSEKYSGPPIIADCGHLYNASNSFQVREMQDNAVFIAHARTDIPALIAEVERLTVRADESATNYQQKRRDIAKLEMENGTLKKALTNAINDHCPCKNDVSKCKYKELDCFDCYIQQAQEGQK